jgi:hypothetical protein
MFNSRRMLRGSRPDSRCLLNHMVAATQPIHPDPRHGRQPAVALPPDRRNIFGRPAPSQIGIRCAAAGPRFAPDPSNVGDVAYQPAAERA